MAGQRLARREPPQKRHDCVTALDKGITIVFAPRLVLTFLGGSESIAKHATVHKRVEEQVTVPVAYRGTDLGLGFRADIVVDGALLLEIKSVDGLNRVHIAQVLNYLKLLRLRRGLLINFNVPLLKQGIRRISN